MEWGVFAIHRIQSVRQIYRDCLGRNPLTAFTGKSVEEGRAHPIYFKESSEKKTCFLFRDSAEISLQDFQPNAATVPHEDGRTRKEFFPGKAVRELPHPKSLPSLRLL